MGLFLLGGNFWDVSHLYSFFLNSVRDEHFLEISEHFSEIFNQLVEEETETEGE